MASYASSDSPSRHRSNIDDLLMNNTELSSPSAVPRSAIPANSAVFVDNEDDSSVTSNSYVTANSSVIDSSRVDAPEEDLDDATAATLISNLDGVNITANRVRSPDNASPKHANIARRYK